MTAAAGAPIVVLDGALVDARAATISVLDRGLLYGDGCFEVLRTWGGRAVEIAAHLARLAETCAYLRLPLPHGMADAVATALAAAPAGEQRIRIVVTRGPGGLARPMADAGPGHAIVVVEPLGPQPETMSLALVDWPLAARAGRGHKTLAYLDHVIARELAREVGADDALRLDAAGYVAEGGTCNVIAVRGATLHVADAGGVLPGIVRARVLAQAGLPVVTGGLTPAQLLAADEVFATSSLRGVVGVTRIATPEGDRALPHGPITQRIAAAYVAEMRGRSVI